MADHKPTGPNQGNDKTGAKAGDGADAKPGQHQQGHAPSQHDGGVGNLQNEPKTADDAKKRAADEAHKKS